MGVSVDIARPRRPQQTNKPPFSQPTINDVVTAAMNKGSNKKDTNNESIYPRTSAIATTSTRAIVVSIAHVPAFCQVLVNVVLVTHSDDDNSNETLNPQCCRVLGCAHGLDEPIRQ